MVDVPAPVIDVGLKVTEFWFPSPDADKVIAESKPPVTAEVIVTLPELLLSMLMVVGDALIEKPGVAPVTVNETVVVSVATPDEVPVTVMLYVPGVVPAGTVIVRVELPAPVIDIGLKPNVRPVGPPEAAKEIAASNPPATALVIVELPALPGATETDVGEADRLKLGD